MTVAAIRIHGAIASTSWFWIEREEPDLVAQPVDEDDLHEEQREDRRAPRPTRLSTSPSIRNGTRIRQFVAPTSRMMPISLRRANIPMRSVFAINATAEASMIAAIDRTPIESTPGDRDEP